MSPKRLLLSESDHVTAVRAAQWLNTYKATEEYKTCADNIYDMVNRGSCLAVYHQQSVLAQKGVKRVNFQSLIIILKGKPIKPDLFINLFKI